MEKKKTFIALMVTGIIAVGVLGGYLGYIFKTVTSRDNKIYPGVSIQGVDLSNKTYDDAYKLLTDKYGSTILNKKINVHSDENTYTLSYSKIDAKFNIKDTVNEALSYGKDKSFIKKFNLIKHPKNYSLKLKLTYDNKPIDDFISNIKKSIDIQPKNASLTLNKDGSFSIIKEKSGRKLETEEIKKSIINEIDEEVSGTDEIKAPITEVKAEVTSEALANVNTKISSFSTDFSNSAEGRATNITLATKTINGTLVMPGQEFSFNTVVGDTTLARGFQMAPVIIGNKVDSGVGGGICQVSTTLYNAILRANLKATVRSHHTLPSHYIGLGLDATVSYGSLDFKFKNTLAYPIYIQGYVNNRNVYFTIYSSVTLTTRSYDVTTEVLETIPYQTIYVDDPTLPEGQTQPGENAITNGYKVNVYRTVSENGNIISKDLLYKDYYAPINQTIKRGTKK